MPDINDLRQKRAQVEAQAKTLAELENPTAEEGEEFDKLSTEFDELTAKIERLEKAEKMAAESSKPIKASTNGKVHATPKAPDVKGAQVARMVMAIGATGGNDPRRAAEYAEQTFGDKDVAMALNTTQSASGGTLVPQAFMPEMIELLRPFSIMRGLVSRVIPLPNGNLSIPKLTGGATSHYVEENADGVVSEQTTGDVQLSAKKLMTIVPVSNELIAYSGINGGIESMIVDDMSRAQGTRQDVAYIRGDGASNTPKGLRNLASVANVIAAVDSVSPTPAQVASDLAKLLLALLNANVSMIQPGYLMSPTTFVYLSNLLDGNGNKVYPEMANGMLGIYPCKWTNNIPANLGAGTNESEIGLTDFADCVIGDSLDLSIDVSKEASYKDPTTGEMFSAFSKDQTVIKLVSANDFGLRHDESTVWLTGVKWGSA